MRALLWRAHIFRRRPGQSGSERHERPQRRFAPLCGNPPLAAMAWRREPMRRPVHVLRRERAPAERLPAAARGACCANTRLGGRSASERQNRPLLLRNPVAKLARPTRHGLVCSFGKIPQSPLLGSSPAKRSDASGPRSENPGWPEGPDEGFWRD